MSTNDKSLVKQPTNAVHAPVPPASTTTVWGSEGTSSNDLVIPRLRLLQQISNQVKEEKGKAGQVVHSLTAELLSDRGQPLEVLPILCRRYLQIHEIVGTGPKKKLRFLRREALTKQNENAPKEGFDVDNKTAIARVKNLSFLVLMVKRTEGFPFLLDFQRTSYKAGKTLSTIVQENAMLGKPAPARVVSLGVQLEAYEQNSWYGWTVVPTRNATDAEINRCKYWFDMFQEAEAKACVIDTEEEEVF